MGLDWIAMCARQTVACCRGCCRRVMQCLYPAKEASYELLDRCVYCCYPAWRSVHYPTLLTKRPVYGVPAFKYDVEARVQHGTYDGNCMRHMESKHQRIY